MANFIDAKEPSGADVAASPQPTPRTALRGAFERLAAAAGAGGASIDGAARAPVLVPLVHDTLDLACLSLVGGKKNFICEHLTP